MNDLIEGSGVPPTGASAAAGGLGGAPRAAPRRSVGEVLASVMDGVRTLARKQVELAKIEMTEAVSVRAKGAGLMAAAGVLGLFAFGFAAAAGSAALDLVLPTWAALLIVAGVFVLIAGGLFLAGRRAATSGPTMPERTKETLKEDARWAKQQIGR